jgi:hypothetical protein
MSLPLALVFYPYLLMSKFHSHIDVMGQQKYYILSIEFVFGLNFISRCCSEFEIIVKTFSFEVTSFSSYKILHSKHMNVFTCSKMSDWNFPLKFRFFRSQWRYFHFKLFYSAMQSIYPLCKPSSEYKKSTWSSQNNIVLNIKYFDIIY